MSVQACTCVAIPRYCAKSGDTKDGLSSTDKLGALEKAGALLKAGHSGRTCLSSSTTKGTDQVKDSPTTLDYWGTIAGGTSSVCDKNAGLSPFQVNACAPCYSKAARPCSITRDHAAQADRLVEMCVLWQNGQGLSGLLPKVWKAVVGGPSRSSPSAIVVTKIKRPPRRESTVRPMHRRFATGYYPDGRSRFTKKSR